MGQWIGATLVWTASLALFGAVGPDRAFPDDALLPEGVERVWDLSKAYREGTPSRERICINGLWRWQPTSNDADAVPTEGWGYFKVPGSWPGITNYMQKDSQTVYDPTSPPLSKGRQGGVSSPPLSKGTETVELSEGGVRGDMRLRDVTAAWYQREITVPEGWEGRRIAVSAEYLNSYAIVYIDGRQTGELLFPSGEVDVTSVCRPGGRYLLSMLVVALPLKGVMLSYSDTASAREVKGSVARRGLCGDVFLVSTPAEERLTDVKVDTSVRQWEIRFDAALQGLKADESYALVAQVKDNGQTVAEFERKPFRADDLSEGKLTFTERWKPEKLWDIHTPQHRYVLHLSLLDSSGAALDTFDPVRFGFREFWIEGRDFYLNGSRIFLSAVPFDNAQVGAAAATYDAARESMEHLKTFGINFVYTHNYGCEPGSHLSFAEILRAADDVGMLVALSQPHFGHYDWDASDADQTNGYTQHAAFYVRVAQRHPSVVMYSMSHNATGYSEDMNPDLIDGLYDKRDAWSLRNSKKAVRAEAIVTALDSSRIVYHHSSGNLGTMHTSNFYANFTPVQEMSDWFEHWATEGVKPVFLVEYGVPFSWDWTMYRGWYNGKREFGSAQVPWEFCLAEWNAQFLGDRAFQISEMEKENLRWESKQFRAGALWHRWDYPHQVGSRDFIERDEVFAMYFTDNWRAFRTWGLSANSPWEHHLLWRLRDNVEKGRVELEVDWNNLQRPGFSPDYIEERYERMDLAFEREDWTPTAGAEALIRNNQPLLAYIGGGPANFTGKTHTFVAGETIEKQLIVINNARVPVNCECTWSLSLPGQIVGENRAIVGLPRVNVETGQQARIPLRIPLPNDMRPGAYQLTGTVTFTTPSSSETQEDTFTVHVLPRRSRPHVDVSIALFDPKGETATQLREMGVPFDTVDATADLSAYDLLIVGKAALTVDGLAPNIDRVRDGLKALLFEQTADVLEKRFGFRVAEYGLRNVFPRVPDHPVLAGLQTEHLRDWRGEATLLPPRLSYELNPKFNNVPTVNWCGIPVPRAWRCGSRGNVASVLIEKPARGDFLPIVDGGFSLQYSPLMEYREGEGAVFFCQMDVTGRTAQDPAADTLTANLIEYVSAWKPSSQRNAFYAGEPKGRAHLQKAGLRLDAYEGGELKASDVLILGPGSGDALSGHKATIDAFLKTGGHLLGIGLTQQDADALLPFKVTMNLTEYINAAFESVGARHASPLLAGIGPSDVHNRDPRAIPLVSMAGERGSEGARERGTVDVFQSEIRNPKSEIGSVLVVVSEGSAVFCQLVPWQFEYEQNFGLKRTFRRTSFLVSRLLANLGITGETPLLSRFSTPVAIDSPGRWLQGFYLDTPEEWDHPYRFFRW